MAKPGENVAESTVAYDQFRLDPLYYTDDNHEPAPVWAASQHLRELVEKQERMPSDADRETLAQATVKQLRTLELYQAVASLVSAKAQKAVSLYVLLFPGEARDKTGIKDLNDKVLGYKFNSEYMELRRKEIATIFAPPPGGAGPHYVTVGQDYKTAYIIAVDKTPQDFAKDLVRLDAKLRDHLLAVLDKAEKATLDPDRLTAIRDLRRTLKRDAKYRFDYLFGANSLTLTGNLIDIVFQLITEALKGAGIARFAVKGSGLRTEPGKKAQRRGIPPTPKRQDDRGQDYDVDVYLRVSGAADDIKKTMTSRGSQADPLDYYSIYVDKVWTVAFLLYRRLYFGNPDVIRDVRKKALERPPVRAGVKFSWPAQVELLELWLVTLNLVDFVSGFVSVEYSREVPRYHEQALLALKNVTDKAQAVEWSPLIRILTHDVRQTGDPTSVLGTTSEFQFYSQVADYPDQIFFTMDVRDLGVDLIAFYEIANKQILDGDLRRIPLMMETFRSNDATLARKRFTHDSVVAVFHKYHGILEKSGSRSIAESAFGGSIHTSGALPDFAKSIQVMIGGDEIFVGAHPLYAEHVHTIIAELDAIQFANQTLNMRAGVAYSAAKMAPGSGSRQTFGPAISPGQRRENQTAHDKAMKLSADAPNMLKAFERAHRRIQRLVDKLEANDRKKHLAPAHLTKLDNLRLMKLFARAKFHHAQPLSDFAYARLHRLLRAEDLAGARGTGFFDLVDFAGREVDGVKLTAQMKELEEAVSRDVGLDNVHIDPPPVNKIPAWIKKLIDKILPPEKIEPPRSPVKPPTNVPIET